MVDGRFLSLQTPTEVAEDNSFKQKKLLKAELARTTTGPKFNQRILEILLRFRSYPVADIEKAFLMISMAPKDRDILRFL
jgi:hypothetical protein